jgi:hypothetical protein
MNEIVLVDADGLTTPYCRAHVLALILQRVAISQQPVEDHALFEAIRKDIALAEEQFAFLVYEALLWLCSFGLVEASKFDRTRGRILTSGGTYRPAYQITDFVWGEPDPDDEVEATL